MLSLLSLAPYEALPLERGPPGTHNTVASYMQTKAAREARGLSCEVCRPAENAVLNCCSDGASWAGLCAEEGSNYTWLAGYEVCNGGESNVTMSEAHFIREERIAENKTISELSPEDQEILLKERKKRKRELHQKKGPERMHHKQGLPGKRAYGGKAKLQQVPEWQQDFDQFKDDQLTKLVDLPSGEKHRIINEAWSASTNARRTARRQLDAAKARLRSLNRGVLTEGEEGTP